MFAQAIGEAASLASIITQVQVMAYSVRSWLGGLSPTAWALLRRACSGCFSGAAADSSIFDNLPWDFRFVTPRSKTARARARLHAAHPAQKRNTRMLCKLQQPIAGASARGRRIS